MNAVAVNVPDVTLDPGDLCGHSGQKPRAQPAACPDRTRTIPATCRQLSVCTGMCT